MRAAAVLTLALATVACATVGEPAPPPGPPAFEGVRSIALVRRAEGPGRRSKDALDALRESLDARGYETRVVEIGPGMRDRRDLERLFTHVHSEVETRAGRDRSGFGVGRIEKEVAASLSALGVDAAAMVHRFDSPGPPMPLGQPFAPPSPGSMFDTSAPPPQRYRPVGALSLVSRAGDVVWLEWGVREPEDPSAPANAAEAIDALLGILTGDVRDEP